MQMYCQLSSLPFFCPANALPAISLYPSYRSGRLGEFHTASHAPIDHAEAIRSVFICFLFLFSSFHFMSECSPKMTIPRHSNWNPVIRSRMSKGGGRKLETGNRITKTEFRKPKSEFRKPKTEYGRPETGTCITKIEFRKPNSGSRKWESDAKIHRF